MHRGLLAALGKKINKQIPHLLISVCFPDNELRQNIVSLFTRFGTELFLKNCENMSETSLSCLERGAVSLGRYAGLRSQLEVTLIAVVALTVVRTKAVITTPWRRQ